MDDWLRVHDYGDDDSVDTESYGGAWDDGGYSDPDPDGYGEAAYDEPDDRGAFTYS